jgi:hypothetical protein
MHNLSLFLTSCLYASCHMYMIGYKDNNNHLILAFKVGRKHRVHQEESCPSLTV